MRRARSPRRRHPRQHRRCVRTDGWQIERDSQCHLPPGLPRKGIDDILCHSRAGATVEFSELGQGVSVRHRYLR